MVEEGALRVLEPHETILTMVDALDGDALQHRSDSSHKVEQIHISRMLVILRKSQNRSFSYSLK